MGPGDSEFDLVVSKIRSRLPAWCTVDVASADPATKCTPPAPKPAPGSGDSLPHLLGRLGNKTRAYKNPLLEGCYSSVANYTKGSVGHSTEQSKQHRKVKYQLHRLEKIALLGCGSFGSVTLVKCHVTGQDLALKAVSKGMLVKKKMEQKVHNEKMVLQSACSPFVVKLAACFNTDQHLYFLMEAAMGGDLFTVYARNELYGSEVHARFHVACVASGLRHLHEQRILYRDVKLENVVLDSQGYAKLCDFGLATFIQPSDAIADMLNPNTARAYTTCGTPEYMAPEIIKGRGYSFAADWWSLGILVFEMLTGKTPFVAKTQKEVFKKIRSGIDKIFFPVHVDWPELVQGLCRHDPVDRLPVRSGGFANLEKSDWFQNCGFDWEAHRQCKMVVPYVPMLKSSSDTSNFDVNQMDKPRDVPYHDTGCGWDQDFEDPVGPAEISSKSGASAEEVFSL